jgi:hypothetical protein
MAFSSALYYPYIDISDEAWLKTAVLYWEDIHTIVPQSSNRLKPYATPTGERLQEAGVLVPLLVESSMEEIESLTYDVTKYLSTPETLQFILNDQINSNSLIHANKLPHEFREIAEDITRLHGEKLPHEIRRILERVLLVVCWLSFATN